MSDLDFEGWSCPLPLRDTPNVVLGHGGGGQLSADLVTNLFLPAYGEAGRVDGPDSGSRLDSGSSPTGHRTPGGPTDPAGEAGLRDSVVLPAPSGRLAFSTDSYVVKPMFFPGGCVGDLAVNGTVNDLAMSGARPLYLSTAFIVAEGTPMAELGRIAEAMGAAALAAGVRLVTGDT